jgi:hypothetical protein
MLSSSLSLDASPIAAAAHANTSTSLYNHPAGGSDGHFLDGTASPAGEGELDDDETMLDSAMDFHLLRQQYPKPHIVGEYFSFATHFRTPSVSSATPSIATVVDPPYAPPAGGGVLSTVQALLTSVDAQSNRMQRTYVESESKRATLQEELMTAQKQLSAMTERCAAAEAACQQLTADAVTSQEVVMTLRSHATDLEQQCASLKGRHSGSLELLRTFNADFEAQRLEWKQSVDSAEGELQRLRVVTAELEGKAAASDALKAKVWSLERQLRSKESDLQETAARVRVLECKLQLVEVDLRSSKDENDSLSVRIATAERQARLSEHALLAEQFRSKHLESLSLTVHSNEVSNNPPPHVAENMRLLGELEKVSMQVVALQDQLRAATKSTKSSAVDHAASVVESLQYSSTDSSNSTALIVNQHRFLEAELHRLTLEKRLAQAEEGHQNVKDASLALSAQVETLSMRLSQALQKQHDAEEIANACRKEMTVALAREMEAVYTKTVTEEQMRYHDGAVESLLFSLAHAESLSLSATAETDRFRKDAYQATVECDRVSQLLASTTATVEHQAYLLTNAQRDRRDAQRLVSEAQENAHRCEIELAAITAFLRTTQEELSSAHQRLVMEQQFTIMSRQNLANSSARLQVLVGDHHHEASLDDILQYLQGSAALLKEVASTCDDVGRNPPVFYGSLAMSALSPLQHLPQSASVTTMQNDLPGSSYHNTRQSEKVPFHQLQSHTAKGGGAVATSHSSSFLLSSVGSGSSSSVRETILAEAAFRNHLVAEEMASWHHMAMSSVAFLGRCADYKDHIRAMTIQLQVASEHAANLFRAVKVFSLRQVRKVRVGAHYRELEQLNQKIWQRAQDIQTILWDVINDPHMTLARRKEIRERLELSTTLAVTIPQSSSSLTNSSTGGGDLHGGGVGGNGSVGELVAHLKLENDRLLEESDRIAQQAASAEARNSELRRKLADVERRAQDQAWLEASPFHLKDPRGTPQDCSMTITSGTTLNEGDTVGVSASTSALSTLHGVVASLTLTAQRSDSLLELYARLCRRTISFAESRVVALHYTGTRNVFDVCVASAFLATALQYRSSSGSGFFESVAHQDNHNNTLELSQNNNPLPLSLSEARSSSTTSAASGGVMAATVSPKLTPTHGKRTDIPEHHKVNNGLELLRVALRNSHASENIANAPDRPEVLHEYCQTDPEEFQRELNFNDPSSLPSTPHLLPRHSSAGGQHTFYHAHIPQSPGAEARKVQQQQLRGNVNAAATYAPTSDPSITRFLHNEESTRSLIREQHAALLAGLLHRLHEQVLWYTQLEMQRVTAELSQSHAMHDGATQVDHKQQLMSYARAVDECNERLVSFMKAKDSSDQECVRLRGELRRAQEDSIVAKRASLHHEEAAGDLRLQLSDSEERVRLLVRDRDQLAQRLRGYAEQNLLLTEQQRLFLKSGIGGAELHRRSRNDRLDQSSQTEESLLYLSLASATAARNLRWGDGPLPLLGGRQTSRVAESSAASTTTGAIRQHVTIHDNEHSPQPESQLSGVPGAASSSGIAIEAASMFSPYVKDIWGSIPRRTEASNRAQQHQLATPQGVASHNHHHEHPYRLSPQRNPPGTAHIVTSPLQDAHSRGYRSLEEWDRVLEAKAEAFLHKEVEWSVKERQLLVLERELDARIKQTSRESSTLRFQLQETKLKLTLVARVARMLLRSRKVRQRHLMSMETAAMMVEDPLRLASSLSSALPIPSSRKTIIAAVTTSVGTQVEKEMLTCELARDAAALPVPGGSWWSSTKGAVLSRVGAR